jgi:hypothetical protein
MCAISSGLLKLRLEKNETLRFEHHRILEYLAACYAKGAEHDEQDIYDRLTNPWWREVVTLRAGVTRILTD